MSVYGFSVKAQDGSGKIVARFEPTADMKDIKTKVEEVL